MSRDSRTELTRLGNLPLTTRRKYALANVVYEVCVVIVKSFIPVASESKCSTLFLVGAGRAGSAGLWKTF